MSLGGVIRALAEALDAAEIQWMVAGSVASSTWGEVRATQDIDVVVEATRTSLLRLCRALPAERWYADEDMAIEASKRRSMFNLVHLLGMDAKDLGVEEELAAVYPGAGR